MSCHGFIKFFCLSLISACTLSITLNAMAAASSGSSYSGHSGHSGVTLQLGAGGNWVAGANRHLTWSQALKPGWQINDAITFRPTHSNWSFGARGFLLHNKPHTTAASAQPYQQLAILAVTNYSLVLGPHLQANMGAGIGLSLNKQAPSSPSIEQTASGTNTGLALLATGGLDYYVHQNWLIGASYSFLANSRPAAQHSYPCLFNNLAGVHLGYVLN